MRRGPIIAVAVSAGLLSGGADPDAGLKMHQALRAFDQCTDRAIYRGEDYAYSLCAHSAYEARAISDAAGLGYKPTERDIRAVIHRKTIDVVRQLPKRPPASPTFDY